MDEMRACNVCKRTFPADRFYVSKNKRSNRCPECNTEASKVCYDNRRQAEKDGIYFGRVRMYPVIDGLKLCPHCNTKKPVDQFDKKEAGKDRLRTRCIECSLKFTVGTRSTVRGFLKYKRDVTLSNSTTGNRKVRAEFIAGNHVTVDELVEIWEQQNGLCAVTKMPMTHQNGDGWIWTNASIDRIDNSVGYAKDNVRLVCTAVNIMRNKMTDEELLWWSKSIVDGLYPQLLCDNC